MNVSLIAAVARNGVIGRDNDLPWNIREDMRFFVRTTKGHAVIMGRRNYEAMGAPLPKRRNIVVTRNEGFTAPGCEVVTSVPQALRMAEEGDEEEAFVIGGAQIYRLALPFAHRFYRTTVLADVPGDVYFPEASWDGFSVTELFRGEVSDENDHGFVVELLERTSSPASFAEEP